MHSVLKSGCSPSSLVKNICYPQEMLFSTPATRWGQKQESAARARYIAECSQTHANMIVNDSGLVIHPDWPQLGASPDGLLACDCCSVGVLEIKWPHSCKGKNIADAVASTQQFCLEATADGSFQLTRSHQYYAQVQAQLHICDVQYCDFVVCLFAEGGAGDLHIARIERDPVFWNECLVKADSFFQEFILRELPGKWFTSGSRRAVQSAALSSPPVPPQTGTAPLPASVQPSTATPLLNPQITMAPLMTHSPATSSSSSTSVTRRSSHLLNHPPVPHQTATPPLPASVPPCTAAAMFNPQGATLSLATHSPGISSRSSTSVTLQSSLLLNPFASRSEKPLSNKCGGIAVGNALSSLSDARPLQSSNRTCCKPLCSLPDHLTLHQCCTCPHVFHHICRSDDSGKQCLCCASSLSCEV